MNVPAEFCCMSASVAQASEKIPRDIHFPFWLVQRCGGGGKQSEPSPALRSAGILYTWHDATSPQETQLLQNTAVCPYHLKAPASISDWFLLSVLPPHTQTQGLSHDFPADFWDCTRYCSGLLAGVNSTALRGTMKHFSTRANKAYLCLREVRTSVIPICQLENRCTGS